jgi:predicted RNA-binding protein YlxR (DUF448 family)
VASARTTAGGGQDEAGTGSLRLCAVSRAQKPPENLIRFVLAPDGSIVPDLARRLPGRGVWVGATRATVAAAVRQKVFAKSLKQQVSTPDDLAALVERLLVKRVCEALSLANKAGLLVAGFAKVEELLDRHQVAVLLQASDAAADGVDKLNRKFKALVGSERFETSTVAELTSVELSLAIGRPNVVHAAASEGGASQRMLQEALRLKRYRAGEGDGPGLSRH